MNSNEIQSKLDPFWLFWAIFNGFLLKEDLFKALWVLELGEIFWAFQVEPKNLSLMRITCSLLQVM
jgi:hypothetical protein